MNILKRIVGAIPMLNKPIKSNNKFFLRISGSTPIGLVILVGSMVSKYYTKSNKVSKGRFSGEILIGPKIESENLYKLYCRPV